MQSYDLAAAYVHALTGTDPAAIVMDWRMLSDTDAGAQGVNLRGTLPHVWNDILNWQAVGYGAFAVINEMDGIGRKLENVVSIRAHVIDNDNISAPANQARAAAWSPSPCFAVITSPGKSHTYWPIANRYKDNDRYATIQRKLRQLFDADPAITDPTRVMRVPGTLHLKTPSTPHLVTCHSLPGYLQRTTPEALEAALANVTVIDAGPSGARHALGDTELAAPSLEWLNYALGQIDPNTLSRHDWISVTAATKQAGYTFGENETYALWSNWCARYTNNDVSENQKQWKSLRETQLGWHSLVGRVPLLRAFLTLGNHTINAPPLPAPDVSDTQVAYGEFLNRDEQAAYFKGCVLIESTGRIMTPGGRMMDATRFNAKYGGKKFIYSSDGKITDEAWKAATRGMEYKVAQVDHTRFLPERAFGDIVVDQLGRRGVNTYIPIRINAIPGDVTPFLRNLELMLPDPNDRAILLAYLAHNVKFPGFKIPWAPMVQSTEGVGKGFLMEAMERIIGEMYCYSPKADQLVASGATFNGWMRNRLFIVVNEIKTDEKRELIEILKPLLSDARVEVQSKGIDQEMEDNPANWLCFSNYKNAIPINKNGRRWSVFYSAIQSAADLLARGMNDAYFNELFRWLRADGAAHVAHYFLNYPIERGQIPMRAPETSSTAEARAISRGPIERLITESVEDGLPGFCSGWVSGTRLDMRIKERGARPVSAQTLEDILASMGYTALGRAPRAYFQEGPDRRPYLFNLDPGANTADYGRLQGYGD